MIGIISIYLLKIYNMAKSYNKYNTRKIHLKTLLVPGLLHTFGNLQYTCVRQMVCSACMLNIVHMASKTPFTAPNVGCEVMPCFSLKCPLISVYVYLSHDTFHQLSMCPSPQHSQKILKSTYLTSQVSFRMSIPGLISLMRLARATHQGNVAAFSSQPLCGRSRLCP